MEHLTKLREKEKFAYNTPINRAKTYGNVNFSAIIEESYSQMKTMASTGKKKFMKLTNYVKIQTNGDEYYEGEVDKNFVRSGYGRYHYHNGDVYEGEFKNGQRNGLGEYKYKDDCLYRGQWLKDKKNGRGIIKIDKKEYEGMWENDKFVSGIKYKINEFERIDIANNSDISYRNHHHTSSHVELIKQTNNSDIGNTYYECSINENPNFINKFNFKFCETDSVDNLKNDIINNWNIINSIDYLIDIEVDFLQKKENKIKFIETSETTNTNLTHISNAFTKFSEKDGEMNSLCYFQHLKNIFDENNMNKNICDEKLESFKHNNSVNDSISCTEDSFDNKFTCHCDKFFTEIL